MQPLIDIDTGLFIFLNQSIANVVLDIIMPFLTNLDNWRIPILVIWLLLLWKGGKKGRVAALLLIPVLTMSDYTSSSILKPLFGRIRPCHVMEEVRLLVNCGSGLAFPSSHATNISAVAVMFSFFYRKGIAIFLFVAFMVGLSRIYVGVHYPADVLFGFMVGTGISFLLIYFYLLLAEKYPRIDYRQDGNKKESS
jgi:undecaprenyl-diphosphatase